MRKDEDRQVAGRLEGQGPPQLLLQTAPFTNRHRLGHLPQTCTLPLRVRCVEVGRLAPSRHQRDHCSAARRVHRRRVQPLNREAV